MFSKVQKIIRILIVFVFSFFTLFFLSIVWFVFGIHSDSRTLQASSAFWMEHSWSRGTENDFYFLREQIKDTNTTDLYFHVGPLGPNGELAEDLKIFVPGLDALDTTNYAWIGQVRSKIDLDDPEVRQGIIDSSKWILTQGFDGIHVDIEPVFADDEGFYLLLEELRVQIPDTKISVAMDEWQPDLLSKLLGWVVKEEIKSYWKTKQIKRVAEQVDQLVVMTYDTRFRDPSLYKWWVEQQTIALSQIVPDGLELFIGIPAYEEGAGIDPNAENVGTGLRGFNRGVRNIRSDIDKITGVAIYSYWEMDNSEWALIEEL